VAAESVFSVVNGNFHNSEFLKMLCFSHAHDAIS